MPAPARPPSSGRGVAGSVSLRSKASAAASRGGASYELPPYRYWRCAVARQRTNHLGAAHRQDFADEGGADLGAAFGDQDLATSWPRFPSTAFLLTWSAMPSFCSSAAEHDTAGAAGLRIAYRQPLRASISACLNASAVEISGSRRALAHDDPGDGAAEIGDCCPARTGRVLRVRRSRDSDRTTRSAFSPPWIRSRSVPAVSKLRSSLWPVSRSNSAPSAVTIVFTAPALMTLMSARPSLLMGWIVIEQNDFVTR